MIAIIKTWPAFMTTKHTLEVFRHDWAQFYFSLGRGKPVHTPEQLYFTHRGRILGHFNISEIVRNEGQLPKLESLSGETSEWQIGWRNWVAICRKPIKLLGEKLYYMPFRGWRYFDLEKHRGSLDSKIRL